MWFYWQISNGQNMMNGFLLSCIIDIVQISTFCLHACAACSWLPIPEDSAFLFRQKGKNMNQHSSLIFTC